jgi:hypothetical protein
MRLSAAALVLCLVTIPALAEDPPLRPDPTLTPGATDPAVRQTNIASTICRSGGYTKSVRHTSGVLKAKVYAEYGITSNKAGEFEIDYLISLELGGADVQANLWPQSYVTQPLNAHVKDRLEDRLHALVCHGTVTLATAQQALTSDWVAAYGKYVGALPR